MSRVRMTHEERERRRKERARLSFSDAAYKHYDPDKEGFGNPEDWENIAQLLYGERAQTKDENLSILGLSTFPSVLEELKTAFRQAMFRAHPDHGGTSAQARRVLEAFAALKKRFAT